MEHEEFEKQMFSLVNENYQMKELNRQEVARAAQEERQHICKCEKINAVIGIIMLVACFVTIIFALCVMNWTGFLPALVGMVITAVLGLVFGMSIQSLSNRIKN